jgi:hypothetical protein
VALRLFLAAVLVWFSGAGAVAGAPPDPLYKNGAVTCVATSPEVVGMSVDGLKLRFSLSGAHAEGRVHLLMSDNSARHYKVRGKAVLIGKKLPRNSAKRSYSYAGIECTARHRNIASVHNCRGGGASQKCDVGLEIARLRLSFRVSLDVERIVTPFQLLP